MKKMTITQLLQDVPHKIIQEGDTTHITHLTIDSRQVTPSSLFICLKGLTVDGHSFINNTTAGAVLVETLQDSYPLGATIIQVANTRQAMAYIAANFHHHPAKSLRLVGVTGTNGKTTTTYFIEEMLRKSNIKTGLIGTVGARIGTTPLDMDFATSTTPDPIELHAIFAKMLAEKVDTVVMEVSSHALALYKMAGLTFDVGVFTNLTQDHLDFHGTMENYKMAKAELFKQSTFAIVNADDEASKTMLEVHGSNKYATYSIDQPSDWQASNISYLPVGANFYVQNTAYKLPISGKFNIYNMLATMAVATQLGCTPANIKTAVEAMSNVPGRIQSVPNPFGAQIYVDYAHSPDSLEKIIASVREITRGRVITLFGCGGDRDTTKRPIMGQIAAAGSDFVIITSDNPRTENPFDILSQIEAGVKNVECALIESRKAAIYTGVKMLNKNDALIIAGKGHEDYQEVNGVKYPFSDYDTAAAAIKQRGTK